MKIFPTHRIPEIDQYTIKNEPISDYDLMERAASKIANWIMNSEHLRGEVYIFIGPGNNGGDGLAVARMLNDLNERFKVTVFIYNPKNVFTSSADKNRIILEQLRGVKVNYITSEIDFPDIKSETIIIDALFGAGLTRPLKGIVSALVKHINTSGAKCIAIDIPSGLLGESNSDNDFESIIKADHTLTFQFPKLSLLFADNYEYAGEVVVQDISLHQTIMDEIPSNNYFVEKEMISEIIQKRKFFSHKGTFGHALIIAGSYGKMGAAVLASKACLRSGVGLLTVHIPAKGYEIMQTTLPEAMVEVDDSEYIISSPKTDPIYAAIGIGPGLGKKVNTIRAFKNVIENTDTPLVIDADGINILGDNKEWLAKLPAGTILTPHPKEFERIAGKSDDNYSELQKLRKIASKYNIYIALKGAFTKIACPNGDVYFNSTGNQGMATAGSGDVLTGILTALLAQGYSPKDVCLIGVFIHGVAGDIAAKHFGCESLIASDIINNLGAAFKEVKK